MGSQGPDRRTKNSDRRKSGLGKPPPGTVIDRRLGLDQRVENDPRAKGTKPTTKAAASTGDKATGLERKRGRGRRLSEFTKAAEEGEMTTEQFLFLMAIDAFKKGNDRMFPTWTDVLEVIRLLGYRKTMPTELNLPSAEDWLERSDAPANVRPDRWAERFTDDQLGIEMGNESAISTPKKTRTKTEAELTDEALDAFEAAFSEDDDNFEADEFLGEDFDDIDDGYSEAA